MTDIVSEKKYNLITFGEKPYDCVNVDSNISLTFNEILKQENTEKFVNDYVSLLTSIESYLSNNDIRVDEIDICGTFSFYCEENTSSELEKIIVDADTTYGLSSEEYKRVESVLLLNLVKMELTVDYNCIGTNLNSENMTSVEDMWYYGDISSSVADNLPRGTISGVVDINKLIGLLSENNIKFTINSNSELNRIVSDSTSLFKFILENPEACPSLNTSYGFVLKRKKTK